MKQYLLIVFSILLISCKPDVETKSEELLDLNLYLTTEEDIDSVWITDITQNREVHKAAFNYTLRFKFKDSINDLYNIWFWRDGEIVSSPMPNSQLWLKGDNIQIKGNIDKKLIIDTVINSPMYYSSKEYNEGYRNLFKNKLSLEKKNAFILQQIKENNNSAISLSMADAYYRLNENNPENLRILHQLLSSQDSGLRNHGYFKVLERVNTKLNDYPIDLSKYSFRDLSDEPVKIELETGKKYLIDAWFVNCPPCVVDHKIVATDLDLFEAKKVEIIGLSVDQEHEVWKQYLEKNNYNWRNYRVDQNKPQDELSKDLRLGAFPNYILLNGSGKIEFSTNSYEEIKKHLEINS